MKLFVDDERKAPNGWHGVKTINEAIRTIARYQTCIESISLDHDSGNPDEPFTAIAHFIGALYGKGFSPKITVHSANIVGAKDIINTLEGWGVKASIATYKPNELK